MGKQEAPSPSLAAGERAQESGNSHNVHDTPFLVYPWMVLGGRDGLGLSTLADVLYYADVYAVSHDGLGVYCLPVSYAAHRIGVSERTMTRCRQRLEKNGLIFHARDVRPVGQRGGSPTKGYAVCQSLADEVRHRYEDDLLAATALGIRTDTFAERNVEKPVEGAVGSVSNISEGVGLSSSEGDGLTCSEDDTVVQNDSLSPLCFDALTCANASYEQDFSITQSLLNSLVAEARRLLLTDVDVDTLKQLLKEAPYPVDDKHVAQVVNAYAVAANDGYVPEDMIVGLRSYKRWASNKRLENPNFRHTLYLYVYLARQKNGAHNCFLVDAREKRERRIRLAQGGSGF